MRGNLARWLCGATAMAAIGCSGGDDPTDALATMVRRYEGTITTVAIDTSEGEVSLEGSDTRIVEARFTPGREGDNFQGQLSNGRLALGSVCQDGQIGCGTSIAVSLPGTTDFEVASESGDVTIDGMTFAGSVYTVVGSVVATNLGQVDLEVENANGGNQDISFRLQPVRVIMNGANTSNLTIRLPPGDYQFEIETGGSTLFETGDVRDAEFGPVIEMTTGVGQVVVTRS